ncbi:hypothetical protein GGI21_000643 [Coemansia aciculifera]|nr:hypothetical protein GGI21_000643 [Coemansia aciculifera]
MSIHTSDEQRQQQHPAVEPWNADNDRVLEQLALNEDISIPWAELRRIIRQKLAYAVELLTRHQEKAADIAKQESDRREEREDANSIDQSEDTPSGSSSRKRVRTESASATDVRIQTVVAESSESPANGSHKDEDNDEIMSEAGNNDMAVSEVSPEPTSSSQSSLDSLVENGQEEGREGEAAANVDGIAPEVANGNHHDEQEEAAVEEPKDDTHREHVVDAVREMRDLEERIGYCLHTFDEAPFTIQRIAELLMWPERHYRNVIKFLRAVERVVYVTSTVDEFPLTIDRSIDEQQQQQQVDMPIESDGSAQAASTSLFSFLAVAQDEQPGSAAADISASVQTKAVTMRPPSTSFTKAVDARASPGSSTLTMMPPPLGTNGAPPLDASDTGILHIVPTSVENEDMLRAKIGASIDTAGIPVCIDELDGKSGKVAVQPVHLTPNAMETNWTDGEREMARETSSNE